MIIGTGTYTSTISRGTSAICSISGRGVATTRVENSVGGGLHRLNTLACGSRIRKASGSRRVGLVISRVSSLGSGLSIMGRRVTITGSREEYPKYGTIVPGGSMFYGVYNVGVSSASRSFRL